MALEKKKEGKEEGNFFERERGGHIIVLEPIIYKPWCYPNLDPDIDPVPDPDPDLDHDPDHDPDPGPFPGSDPDPDPFPGSDLFNGLVLYLVLNSTRTKS